MDTILKLKVLAKKKESVRGKLAVTAKELAAVARERESIRSRLEITAKEKESVRGKLAVTAETLRLKAKQLAVTAKENETIKGKLEITAKQLAVIAKERETVRRKLEITAKQLATTAKEKESVRGKLAVTAEQLAETAKERESVRSKLAVTAETLRLKAKQLATTAKEKESIRSKLAVTAETLRLKAKQLATTAKEKESIRGRLEITAEKLAVTAKEKESVRGKLAVTAETLRLKAKQLAVTAKEKESVRGRLEVTAKQLAETAKERESVRGRLVVTAKQLAETAKERESVRGRLVVTAKQLAVTAEEKESVRSKLAVTAKELAETAEEKESVRRKLEVTAKQLAATAKEKESVRAKLAVTAKEKESVRGRLVVTAETLRLKAKQLAVTAKEKESIRGKLEITAKQLAVTAKERESANKYSRSLIEASLDPLVTISPEGKITDVNKATIKVTDVSREKLIGTDFSNYFTEPDKALDGYKQVFEKGFVTDYPLTIRSADGKLTDVLYNASLYKDDKGNVLGVFAAARDVTETKKLQSESLALASIIESSDNAVVGKTLGGVITSWNKAAEKMYGYTAKEVMGKNVSIVAPRDREDEIPEILKRVAKGEKIEQYETVRRRKDGTNVSISLAVSPIKDISGKIIGASAIGRDITELKKIEEKANKAEEEIKRVSAYSRSLIEASLDPLVTISAEGKVTDVNKATIKVTGVAREKLIGTDFLNYFTEPEKAREGYKQVFKQGFVTDYPLTIRSQTGKLTDVLYNASLYKDDKGNVLGVFAAARDVTETKKATELIESTNKELRALDLAKDEFVSIASHQLRTPLTALKGYTGMLLDGDPGPINDKQRDYLGEIKNANDRMIGLITALLNVSRVDLGVFVVEPEMVNLEKVLGSVVKEMETKVKDKKLQVNTNLEKDLPMISAVSRPSSPFLA